MLKYKYIKLLSQRMDVIVEFLSTKDVAGSEEWFSGIEHESSMLFDFLINKHSFIK